MKLLKWFGTIGLVIIVLMAGTFLSARFKLMDLDDEARSKAPGDFVELGDGQVHYAWHGAPKGLASENVIVLVHGFSTPSFVWAGLLGPFENANRRVLIYDNFGRGYSDRPHAANDAELFDRQLSELLESQGIDQPIDLVGYSMGGAIATYFAANHPEKVRRLGLIAPAGFPVVLPSVAKWLTAPLLGDWLMTVFGRGVMLETMSLPENQGHAIPDIATRYEVQMGYEGYLRSLLSTMRSFPMGDLEQEYEAVGESNIPVMAIWGDRDAVVPPGNARLVAAAVPRAELVSIEGGTHAITYSEPEQVSTALIQFFASRSVDETGARTP